jgi:hypothetical protein
MKIQCHLYRGEKQQKFSNNIMYVFKQGLHKNNKQLDLL